MLLTFEPLQAAEGDCLLLHWGSVADPKLAVIDGGPGNIYENSLRPRLDEILTNRGLDQLEIELVMVSHVDNDHVVGIKKLFRTLKSEVENSVSGAERPIVAKRLWHNIFNDVLGDSIDQYYRTLTSSLQASVGGEPNPAVVEGLESAFITRYGVSAEDAEYEALDVGLLLAGHGEGRDLRDSHKYLYDAQQIAALNNPFKKNGNPTLITAEMTPQPLKLAGLEIKIVGPAEAEIQALQKQFDQYIKAKGLTAEAVLAAYTDRSIPNLSSIVCLVKLDGKKILLTGDARGDKIIAGLEAAGLLHKGRLSVDVLKVPHHGSARNVTAEFFETIHANTYVFSGNGKHGNPDRATLEWLSGARGDDAAYNIVLTYPIETIDEERKRESAKKRKSWNKKKHSLAALFEGLDQDGFKFQVVQGSPHKIDLGDERVPW